MNFACNCKRRMAQSHKYIFLGNYASMNKSHFVETSFRLSHLANTIAISVGIRILCLSLLLARSPLFLLSSQLPQFPFFIFQFTLCRVVITFRGWFFFLLCERYSTLALVVYAALSKPLKLFSLHTYLTLIIHVFFSSFLPSSPSPSFQNYLPFHSNKNKLSKIPLASTKPTQGKE